ncbi:type III secretion system export apparatus subunit SctS [Stenotrophomonas sp. NPDC047960]|jgi:type III secretion protein S|uniref:type III secretion system export apparatus subunit SctS n=2 Tax=unclassified Stenotrophomonas TaxID=196198 RepID=UPI003717E748
MDAIMFMGNKSLLLILLLSAAPVAVATIVGLAIGLFQTVTQLQEQTLPYGAKLLSVIACLLVLMTWMSARMLDFARLALHTALNG